jgi:HSP20 family molecular chaperone IbpA
MARIDIETIENSKIRREWDDDSNQYFYSIVDVIGIVTNSSDSRNYWKVLKSRLKNTQNELVTKCNQLKMKANDGKFYLTDVADSNTLLQIIKLVSKESLSVFELWFDQKEKEKVDSKTTKDLTNLWGGKTDNSQNKETDGSYPQPDDAELQIDAYQTNTDIYICAFVAGVMESDLSVTVNCKEITIRGKRELKNNIKEFNFREQELYWGSFSRTVPLPEEIEMEKSEAINSHGVLKLKLPKINKSLTKKLEIKFI